MLMSGFSTVFGNVSFSRVLVGPTDSLMCACVRVGENYTVHLDKMCGIGRAVEPVVKKFLTGVPHKFDVAKGDPTLEGVIIDVDMKTGKAHSIERLRIAL